MIGPGPSTRPYLIRALHDWCTDNGFTPYLAVFVDDTVQVPAEYVKNREIVLNVSFEATSGLRLGNDFVEFKARFGGVARDIVVPVDHVVAIYARENGQGMAFPIPGDTPVVGPVPASAPTPAAKPEPGSAPKVVRLAGAVAIPGASAAPSVVAPAPLAPRPAPKAERKPQTPGGEPPTPPAGRPALKRIK